MGAIARSRRRRLLALYAWRVKFLIGPHSGSTGKRPANAIDLLWQRLPVGHREVSFARVGPEIVATLQESAPTSFSMDADVRVRVGRRAVLEIVREVCGRTPELELDWFAVGFFN
jgi:hypothetical protein